MSGIQWILDHQSDIASYVTYCMVSLVGFAHGFILFAKGLRAISRLTASKADDAAADKLVAVATKLEEIVGFVSKWHSRLMPQVQPAQLVAADTNPETPSAKKDAQ